MINYIRAIAQKKAKGAIILDGKHVADTIQCVHCSAHWIPISGSGRQRGWCLHCKGPLCGQSLCMGSCIPLERRLEGWEQGLTRRQVLTRMEKSRKYIILG